MYAKVCYGKPYAIGKRRTYYRHKNIDWIVCTTWRGWQWSIYRSTNMAAQPTLGRFAQVIVYLGPSYDNNPKPIILLTPPKGLFLIRGGTDYDSRGKEDDSGTIPIRWVSGPLDFDFFCVSRDEQKSNNSLWSPP